MNDKTYSLLLKSRVFPDIEQQVAFWNRRFSGIGDIDRRALGGPTSGQSIQVCFPRVRVLSDGNALLYGTLRIREVLNALCEETGTGLCDDSDFFRPDVLKREGERVRSFEDRFNTQDSNLIVAFVQFWMLNASLKLPENQLPMSISIASALLCMVQGGPRNLWGGGFEEHWFCCLGSPAVYGGFPCFDTFGNSLCVTPREYIGKPERLGGVASIFV